MSQKCCEITLKAICNTFYSLQIRGMMDIFGSWNASQRGNVLEDLKVLLTLDLLWLMGLVTVRFTNKQFFLGF